MNTRARLPIGIENFEDIRRNGFYYVDKTALIRDILEGSGNTNLFTRPRRFGKSLNMNMLKYFFEYGCEPQLFEGLAISEEPQARTVKFTIWLYRTVRYGKFSLTRFWNRSSRRPEEIQPRWMPSVTHSQTEMPNQAMATVISWWKSKKKVLAL